jgi:hypothetical protein
MTNEEIVLQIAIAKYEQSKSDLFWYEVQAVVLTAVAVAFGIALWVAK